jgi:hypothetical protein
MTGHPHRVDNDPQGHSIQAPQPVLYTVSAAGSDCEQGYPADVARAVSADLNNHPDAQQRRWRWLPVAYGAAGIYGVPGRVPGVWPMQPSIDAGVEEMTRLMRQHPPEQSWGVVAHSEGCMVTATILDLCGITETGGPTTLAAYKDSFLGGVHFGSPRREKGHTFPGGNDPGGHGIARPTLRGTPKTLWEFAAGREQPGAQGYDLYTTAGHHGDLFTEDDEFEFWEMIRTITVKDLAQFKNLPTVLCWEPTRTGLFVAIADALGCPDGQGLLARRSYHQITPIPGDSRDCVSIAIEYLARIGNAEKADRR